MKILTFVFLAISGIFAVRLRRSLHEVPISIEDTPFFVSIRRDTVHICGGALITTKHILTAAHCVLNEQLLPVSNLMVVGGANTSVASGILHQITHIIYPPEFRQTTRFHDLAVLLLSECVEMGTTQNVIEVSTVPPEYEEFARFITFHHASDGLLPADPLTQFPFHKLDYLVMPSTFCIPDNYKELFENSGFLCVLSPEAETWYETDLGGPLVQDGTIIGIASWIVRRHKEPYYTDVSILSDFINEAKKCLDSSCASPTCHVLPYNVESLYD